MVVIHSALPLLEKLALCSIDPEVVFESVHFPCLQALSIQDISSATVYKYPEMTSSIARLPALTELSFLHVNDCDDVKTLLSGTAYRSSLRKLSLRGDIHTPYQEMFKPYLDQLSDFQNLSHLTLQLYELAEGEEERAHSRHFIPRLCPKLEYLDLTEADFKINSYDAFISAAVEMPFVSLCILKMPVCGIQMSNWHLFCAASCTRVDYEERKPVHGSTHLPVLGYLQALPKLAHLNRLTITAPANDVIQSCLTEAHVRAFVQCKSLEILRLENHTLECDVFQTIQQTRDCVIASLFLPGCQLTYPKQHSFHKRKANPNHIWDVCKEGGRPRSPY